MAGELKEPEAIVREKKNIQNRIITNEIKFLI